MANNPVDDRYNPPGIGQNDFDEMRFDEIEVDDLFWLNQSTGDNVILAFKSSARIKKFSLSYLSPASLNPEKKSMNPDVLL